jgi:uncharacterized membrane protein
MVKLFATIYGASAVIFIALDFAWLSIMGPTFYRRTLGDIALPTFKLAPAALFYAIYVFGIVFLAVMPAIETGKWQTAALRGIVFGLCAYATYDLTNHATLRNWTAALSAVDIAWGTTLTATTAVLGYLIARLIAGDGAG